MPSIFDLLLLDCRGRGSYRFFGNRQRNLLDSNGSDPVTLHRGDREPAAFEFDGLPGGRNVPEAEEHISGDRFETRVGRKLHTVNGLQVEYARRAIDLHTVGFGMGLRELLVELVLDFADDLLEHI